MLARVLDGAGHDITVVSRSGRRSGGVGKWHAADIRRPEALEGLEGSFDTAVFCAAPADSSDESYSALYVQGLETTCRFLRERSDRLKRIVFTSSTSVYADSDGDSVDERSAAEPTTFSGKRMLEAESVVHESGLPFTVVRFAGIYGPGRDFLLRKLRERSPFSRQSLARISNRIYRDDCVAVVKFLLEAENAAELYLGVDNEPARLDEICQWLVREWNLPEPILSADDEGSGRGNKRCINSALSAVGYKFLAPTFREGFSEMLKAERDLREGKSTLIPSIS